MYTITIPGADELTVLEKMDTNDKNIIDFLFSLYKIPKSLHKKLDAIAIVPQHVYEEYHCTWNKIHEPNNSCLMFETDGIFSKKEFDSVRKTKFFIETWGDESTDTYVIFYKLPEFLKNQDNINLLDTWLNEYDFCRVKFKNDLDKIRKLISKETNDWQKIFHKTLDQYDVD